MKGKPPKGIHPASIKRRKSFRQKKIDGRKALEQARLLYSPAKEKEPT